MGPVEPVGRAVDGPDDERAEQALILVAGERDQSVRLPTAGEFVGAEDGEEGVGEHREGDPVVEPVPLGSGAGGEFLPGSPRQLLAQGICTERARPGGELVVVGDRESVADLPTLQDGAAGAGWLDSGSRKIALS